METVTENRKKWIDALRSKEYKQGRGCLRSADNHYCCLGVAQELFGPGENGGNWGRFSQPTAMVKESIGIFGDQALVVQLMCLNDREQQTFEQIADFLEKRWARE